MIYNLRRKKRLNSKEIVQQLKTNNIAISVRTIERFLASAGFPKLHCHSYQKMGINRKGSIIPARSQNIDTARPEPFRAKCQVAGAFFFLPYILESGIIDIVEKIPLPASNDIGCEQAALSVLLLKLIGKARLSHIEQYNTDRGFGIFAVLSLLPKPTYIMNYSCRSTASEMMRFQKEIVKNFSRQYPSLYESRTINLDFHFISTLWRQIRDGEGLVWK